MTEENKQIRTMKTDAEELLQSEKSSFLDMFGNAKNSSSSESPETFNDRPSSHIAKKILIGFFLVILVAGAGSLGYFFLNQNNDKEPPKPPQLTYPRPYVSVQDTKPLKVRLEDRTGMTKALRELESRSVEKNDFVYVPFVLYDVGVPERLGTVKDFFDSSRATPPIEFYQSLKGPWNIYTTDAGMVFVFEVNNSLQGLRGMLAWEPTLRKDAAFFVPTIGTGTASFEDIIIKNVDVRIARIENTTHGLIHGIALGKYLIVSWNENAFRQTLDRILIAAP